jgi:hypothetical protein
VIWPAADDAEDASADVCEAIPLVTDATPPPMMPPFEVVDEAPADEELSSNKAVGVQTCKKKRKY